MWLNLILESLSLSKSLITPLVILTPRVFTSFMMDRSRFAKPRVYSLPKSSSGGILPVQESLIADNVLQNSLGRLQESQEVMKKSSSVVVVIIDNLEEDSLSVGQESSVATSTNRRSQSI